MDSDRDTSIAEPPLPELQGDLREDEEEEGEPDPDAPFLVRAYQWMTYVPAGEQRNAWRTILWWEKRRPAYNAFVAVLALISLPLFFWLMTRPALYKPGEDTGDLIGLVFAPIGVNLAYTAGWVVECLFFGRITGRRRRRIASGLMIAGLSFTIFVALFPVVVPGIILVLSAVGVSGH